MTHLKWSHQKELLWKVKLGSCSITAGQEGQKCIYLTKTEFFTQVQSIGSWVSLKAGNKYNKYYKKSIRAGLIVLLGLHARGNNTVS